MKYYLTTPIYYVNAAPHLGHAYCTMAADTIKRFKRMQGYDAVLTTGSDEHGQNVERAAKAAGKSAMEYATAIAAEFRSEWDALGLKYDHFIRTSDPKHHETVRDMFERCRKNGYIYEGSYTGQYCFHCELYVSDAKPGDPCPDCGRPTETVTEQNYFFKLSAFETKLLDLYESNPSFIRPEARRNEVISFVRQGLKDLSITRTSIKWGIPAPVEGHHVFYVWFDALISYMSAVKGTDLWPADLHLIGKEIVRFHAVYWPAFLMAAGLPLPKAIYAHGWILFENDKMSKSRGNVVKPLPIQQVMGIEALRYFLLREIVFGQDGSFSYDALVGRYNSDLANGLGNLASRTLTMIQQYSGGVIPASDGDDPIATSARETIRTTIALLDQFEFSRALETLWGLLSAVDKFIVQQAPWKLGSDRYKGRYEKDRYAAGKDKDRYEGRFGGAPEPTVSDEILNLTLYTAAEVLRITAILLAPVLPQSAAKIWKQLGMAGSPEDTPIASLDWGQLPAGQKIGEIAAVFPRVDAKLAIEKMRALEVEETARQAALLGKKPAAALDGTGKISIEDFAKVDLRVGLVLSAEPVKGADKLLHLKIDIGEPEPRTIVAGIAEAYRPEQMLNRKVIIVSNLEPRKLRGVISNGMIMAASTDGGKPVLAGFLEDVPVGARLK